MSGDHSSFHAFVRRILRAYAKRCEYADPEDLAELLTLRADVDAAIQTAVDGMIRHGASWADIARAAGTSRQAAHKRWSRVNQRMTADGR